jgi:hypothetical protein
MGGKFFEEEVMSVQASLATLKQVKARWYIRAMDGRQSFVYHGHRGWMHDKRSARWWKTEAEAQAVLDKLRKAGL